jgi:hypothetical protein
MAEHHSRRAFLVGAGSSAVAGAAVVSAAPTAGVGSRRPFREPAVTADTPLVAYVRDVVSGEIAVMAGDREVVVTDRELAGRLARTLG